MNTQADDQPVTMGALKSILVEMFAESEQRMEAMMDTKLKQMEERIMTAVDSKLAALEKRLERSMEAMMDAKIAELEKNMIELVNDFMKRSDERFVKLERKVRQHTKGFERLEDHSVRIERLELKVV